MHTSTKRTSPLAMVLAIATLSLPMGAVSAASAADFTPLTTITVVPADDDAPVQIGSATYQVRIGEGQNASRSATSLKRQNFVPASSRTNRHPNIAWPYTARTFEAK